MLQPHHQTTGRSAKPTPDPKICQWLLYFHIGRHFGRHKLLSGRLTRFSSSTGGPLVPWFSGLHAPALALVWRKRACIAFQRLIRFVFGFLACTHRIDDHIWATYRKVHRRLLNLRRCPSHSIKSVDVSFHSLHSLHSLPHRESLICGSSCAHPGY